MMVMNVRKQGFHIAWQYTNGDGIWQEVRNVRYGFLEVPGHVVARSGLGDSIPFGDETISKRSFARWTGDCLSPRGEAWLSRLRPGCDASVPVWQEWWADAGGGRRRGALW